MSHKLLVIAAGCLALYGGCSLLPNFADPGQEAQQRQRAQRFDPYPEVENGPNVEGGRPRDYDRPIPEVERARWYHY